MGHFIFQWLYRTHETLDHQWMFDVCSIRRSHAGMNKMSTDHCLIIQKELSWLHIFPKVQFNLTEWQSVRCLHFRQTVVGHSLKYIVMWIVIIGSLWRCSSHCPKDYSTILFYSNYSLGCLIKTSFFIGTIEERCLLVQTAYACCSTIVAQIAEQQLARFCLQALCTTDLLHSPSDHRSGYSVGTLFACSFVPTLSNFDLWQLYDRVHEGYFKSLD